MDFGSLDKIPLFPKYIRKFSIIYVAHPLGIIPSSIMSEVLHLGPLENSVILMRLESTTRCKFSYSKYLMTHYI